MRRAKAFRPKGPSIAVDVDNRRRMNDHRRRLFKEADGKIAFLCECDDDSCTSSVLVAPRRFDEFREHGDQLLYPGHRRPAH